MSISPMDLDSSLDDLIKKRRQTPHKKTSSAFNKQQQERSSNRDKRAIGHPYNRPNKTPAPPAPRGAVKMQKTTQRTSSGINFRLSTPQKVSGPLFTSKNQPPPLPPVPKRGTTVADPSQIVITKAIPTSTPSLSSSLASRIGGGSATNFVQSSSSTAAAAAAKPTSMLSSRLGKPQQPIETRIYRPRPTESTTIQPPPPPPPTQPMSNFAIRGRSVTAAPAAGKSIKGESGPTLLLISGLDPGANDDDLRFAFEEFGNILRCEVLRKRDGTSFGEAEVEFSTKSAALDCIARLDNQLADGRYLRVILRENKSKQSYVAPAKSLQSVLSPTSYTPSGKLYSDQIPSSRYDIRR